MNIPRIKSAAKVFLMIYYEYEHVDDKRFDSYEQAAIAGIEYVLDNWL